MKLTYDEALNVAYISIKENIQSGEVKSTISMNDNIVLDFSGDMRLLGVEILDAKRYLPLDVLAEKASLTH